MAVWREIVQTRRSSVSTIAAEAFMDIQARDLL
jgi:hypothetical protein